MLGVENHFVHPLLYEGDRIGNDFEIRFFADPQIIPHVKVPGFSNQGHDRSIRIEKYLKVEILGGLRRRLAGRAEGGDPGPFELQPLHLLKKIRVARIGAGIASLDVIDAEFDQLLGDPELIFQGERDILGLAAIP